MAKKILIMGLPGSGKTTLARQIAALLNVDWFNADDVRREASDWDFSPEGRRRQAERMARLADESDKAWIVADFVCPRDELRAAFAPDFTIWMNTIKRGRFEDTNRYFRPPSHCDLEITNFDPLDIAHILDALQEGGAPIESCLI